MKNYIRKQIAKLLGIGYLKTVYNKERNFGSNQSYVYLKAIEDNGREADMLFTEHELTTAFMRAKNNKEDYQ
jgi:hypothetical protein